MDERDMERRCIEGARLDGVLWLEGVLREEPRDSAELRLELFRRA